MNDLVRGYAQASFERAASSHRLDEVQADLTTFSAALVGYDRLRGALTDPELGVLARRDIVAQLLSERAAPEAAAIIDFVVRVAPASDLPLEAVELASFAGEQSAAGEALPDSVPVAGRSATRDRIRGYSEAVLQELAATSEIDAVEDELFSLARFLEQSQQLRSFLGDIGLPVAGRSAVLADLLAGKMREITIRLATYVLRAGRTRDVVGTIAWLAELCAEERGRRIGEVRCAVELDPEEIERIAVALSRLVMRPVEVRLVHDPSVMGGVLISVGDLVIDGTIRLRLERLRDALATTSGK